VIPCTAIWMGREEDVLQGEFHHTVDSKGRCFFPAPLKENIGEEPIICYGYKNNLMVYSKEGWQEFVAMIKAKDFEESYVLSHFFIARSSKVTIGPQGRMVIPQTMREFAGITKDVVLVGTGECVEVWSGSAWEENMKEVMQANIFAMMGGKKRNV